MNALLFLSIGLTAVVGSLCTVLYSRLQSLSEVAIVQAEQVGRIEVKLHELIELQTRTARRMDDLATDVLQREIYQSADDRHHMAIQGAREGRSVGELVRKHGLSSDEAALIIALHGKTAADSASARHSAMNPLVSADLDRAV